MTFFVNQTFIKTLDKLDFNYHNVMIHLTKNEIPHEDYVIIKDLSLYVKLKTNQYPFSYQMYQILSRKRELYFEYLINQQKFYLKQVIQPRVDNFKIIYDALSTLNPLYNEIDELPILRIQLLENYEFANGFNDFKMRLQHNVNLDEKGQYLQDSQQLNLLQNTFDIKNIFYYELKVEYSIESL